MRLFLDGAVEAAAVMTYNEYKQVSMPVSAPRTSS